MIRKKIIYIPGRHGTSTIEQRAIAGRGLGICKQFNPGGYYIGLGRGYEHSIKFGMMLGYGFRRGFGGYFVSQFSGLTEKEILEEQKELLQKRFDTASKQLDNLSKSDK